MSSEAELVTLTDLADAQLEVLVAHIKPLKSDVRVGKCICDDRGSGDQFPSNRLTSIETEPIRITPLIKVCSEYSPFTGFE